MPTKTGRTNTCVSPKRLGRYVSDSSRDLTKRLFAWPCRVSVSSCLRWGDLLNTSPPTTVLMKEGFIGFAEKTKTTGEV